MPEALVIETQPEIATLAVAAFKRAGLDAFTVRLSANTAQIMEIPGDVSIVLLNLNGNIDDRSVAGLIAKRWPHALLIILAPRVCSLRDLPASFVLLKPAPHKTLLNLIKRAALVAALVAKSPRKRNFSKRNFDRMSICLDADVASANKRPT